MLSKSMRSGDHNSMNKVIGSNLRFIRKLKKMSLMQLADKMNIKYQQVGKYELGQNQLCAYRIWQASNILGCKVKYFFDETYIKRMHGYHSTQIKRAAAMPSELLDIDQLQLELDNELAYIDFREEQKNANV
jgi:transcriptional regulator with XRE-family HTH domain